VAIYVRHSLSASLYLPTDHDDPLFELLWIKIAAHNRDIYIGALKPDSTCSISCRLVVDLPYSKSTTNRFLVDLLYGCTICCRLAVD